MEEEREALGYSYWYTKELELQCIKALQAIQSPTWVVGSLPCDDGFYAAEALDGRTFYVEIHRDICGPDLEDLMHSWLAEKKEEAEGATVTELVAAMTGQLEDSSTWRGTILTGARPGRINGAFLEPSHTIKTTHWLRLARHSYQLPEVSDLERLAFMGTL
jgi:hypothetical protein